MFTIFKMSMNNSKTRTCFYGRNTIPISYHFMDFPLVIEPVANCGKTSFF